MIKVQNVSKHYGDFKAIDDVSFDVNKGEIVAFLGPNGAGKTTTMRIITGFMAPTKGNVLINGVDIFDEPNAVKSTIGYLPEHPPLYPELTVKEYLTFVAELKKVAKDKIKQQVDEVIEMTGLPERRNTLIAFLSKGLKQRVGIAQSIVNSPTVLILDEPSVGLDPKQVIDIRHLINRLAKSENRTIIISTHILKEASDTCEKVVIINDGKIITVDSMKNLLVSQQKHFKIQATVARNANKLKDKLKAIGDISKLTINDNKIEIVANSDVREEIAKSIVDSGAGLVGLIRKHDTLEDVFVKLVQ